MIWEGGPRKLFDNWNFSQKHLKWRLRAEGVKWRMKSNIMFCDSTQNDVRHLVGPGRCKLHLRIKTVMIESSRTAYTLNLWKIVFSVQKYILLISRHFLLWYETYTKQAVLEKCTWKGLRTGWATVFHLMSKQTLISLDWRKVFSLWDSFGVKYKFRPGLGRRALGVTGETFLAWAWERKEKTGRR